VTVVQVSSRRAAWGLGFLLLLQACAPAAPGDAPPGPVAQPPAPAASEPRSQALSDARATHPAKPRLSREQLLAQLRERLSRPAGGLREQLGPDGSRRIALDGHLQHATLAIVDADGHVHTSCVDSPAAAARALGLDQSAGTP